MVSIEAYQIRPLFWAVPFGLLGVFMYAAAVLIAAFRYLTSMADDLFALSAVIIWNSGLPTFSFFVCAAVDLFLLLPSKRRRDPYVPDAPLSDRTLAVILTAYNDEKSIALAVKDFINHPFVKRVIVIDNNSRDRTSELAARAGAIVVHEPTQGYGACCFRGWKEALNLRDTHLIALCEGDMTFRAADLEKLMAFIPHADIVNGTRISEQLRERETQLTTFMYYGNFFVGKLLELKHLGRGTFTDVGTTYKLCRAAAIRRLINHLNPGVNLEFNLHFLDVALDLGIQIVECPITFHARVGVSKGGNVSNLRAACVGLRMIKGIYFGWGRRGA
jgi:hypothetical protein